MTTAGSEKMRIVSDGRVGIGTSTPGTGILLDVNGTSRTSNLIAGGYLRDALAPTQFDISGGNISNSVTTRSSNFVTHTASSNNIGGVTLSNTNVTFAGAITGSTANTNNTIGGVAISNQNIRLGGPIDTSFTAAVAEFGRGFTFGGLSGLSALAFQFGGTGGGFRHFIRSRHNSVVNDSGNALDFFTNNATTLGVSTTPGTGNFLAMSMTSAGVGIGMSNPTARLDVCGDMIVGGSVTSNLIRFRGLPGDLGSNMTVLAERLYGASDVTELLLFKGNDQGQDRIRHRAGEHRFQTYTTPEDFSTLADNNNRLTIINNGNVGIGTVAPATALDVSGGDPTMTVRNNAGSGTIRIAGSGINPASGLQVYHNSVNQGLYASNALPMLFTTSNTERMRILANGGVGIGTVAPGATLDVSGTEPTMIVRAPANCTIRVAGAGVDPATGIQLYHNATTQGLYAFNALPMLFFTSNAERIRIAANGNVGINASDPGRRLDVNGTARVSADLQFASGFSTQITTGSIANGASGVVTAWSNIMPARASNYSCLVAVAANIRATGTPNVGGALYAIGQYNTGTYTVLQMSLVGGGLGITLTTTTSNISLSNTVGSTQTFDVTFTVLGSNRT
jgi:hypothetical protein